MTVSKYKKGLWKIDISAGYDELTLKRKRIRKTGFTSKKQAEEYEAHIKLFELNELKPRQKISIDYLYSWLKKKMKSVETHSQPKIHRILIIVYTFQSSLLKQICDL